MPKFKVGDRVRLSEDGRRRWTDEPINPHNGVGTVRRYSPDGFEEDPEDDPPFVIDVKWDEQISVNSYHEGEIELIDPAAEETEVKEDPVEKIISEFDFEPIQCFITISKWEYFDSRRPSIDRIKKAAREALRAAIKHESDSVCVDTGGMLAIKQNGRIRLSFIPFGISNLVEIEKPKPKCDGIRHLDLDD